MTRATGSGPATVAVAGIVTDAILAILPALPRSEITPDKHLRDIGADSVDRVEIIMTITERLGLDEPMSSFAALPDIGALIRFLTDRGRA